VLLGLERFSEAHHALEEAFRLGYSAVEVHNWQGLVYRAERKWDKAVESITQSIQADPFAAKYYFNRGQCHQFAGAMGNALEDFSRALAHDPGEAWFDLARSSRVNAGPRVRDNGF
jgi:tetratricopeptide (TPR) repeat protein